MNDMMTVASAVPRSTAAQPIQAAVRTIWRVLIERIWVLVGVTAVLFTAAAIYVFMLTPIYSSATLLKVDPTATPIAGVDPTTRPYQPDRAAMQSEVSVIHSLDSAKTVATKLNLFNDPEFDFDGSDAQGVSPNQRLEDIAAALLDSVEVALSEDSYVITITASSSDPVKAARIADAFADVYIGSNVVTRTGTAEEQRKWLTQQRLKIGQEVQQADAQVAEYKAAAGIVVGGANGTITDQQVGPLAGQMASAESEAAEARARLNSARAQIARGDMDAVASVLGSPVVTNLRAQRAEVVRNRDDIASRYGPLHPETQKVTQQLNSIDDQIKQEAGRVTASLLSASLAADARAASLRQSLATLRSEQSKNTGASVKLDALQRNADAKRQAYNQLAKAEQDTEQAARNSLPNIRIIEHARPADKPTSPHRMLLLAAALLVAAVSGTAVITAQELMTRGVRSLRDVETVLGVPMLAAIPRLPRSAKTTLPADLPIDKPMTYYAEAFRTLRSALIQLAGGERLPPVIAVTSSIPGEGKSTTALSLARVMALAGDKVIVVDCDIRRVGIKEQTGYHSDVTLVDVLRKGVDHRLAIQPDRVSGVDLISNNEPTFTPVDLFTGEAMVAILDQLKRSYDTVILDTPPLLGVADTRTLVRMGGAVLHVIRWDHTPIDAVDKALTMMQQDNVALAGAVLVAVDPSAELMGADYYSDKYAAYYRN